MLTFNDYKKVNNSGTYVNTETTNVQTYAYSSDLKVVIASPYMYKDAATDFEYLALYSEINSMNNVHATKVCAPLPDFENLLNTKNEILCDISSRTKLVDFDVVVIPLNDELTYTNMINILTVGGIENTVKRRDRARESKKMPIVIAIGKCLYKNEAMLSKFVDILIDGESSVCIKSVLNIIEKYIKEATAKKENYAQYKEKLYNEIGTLGFVYIKGFAENPTYAFDKENVSKPFKYLSIPSLITKTNKAIVKVTKGCNRNCTNCMEKAIYGSMYEKPTDYAVLDALKYVETSGIRDVLICSNCYLDYTNKKDLIYYLNEEKICRSISFSDTYIDKTNVDFLKYIDTSIPKIKIDSASEKIRKEYGNSITDSEIYDIARQIFNKGYYKLKLVVTLGIPSETYEDIGNIYEIANKIIDIYFEINSKLPDKYVVAIEFNYYEICKNTPSFETKFNTLEQLELKERYVKDKKHSDYIILEFEDRYKSYLRNVIRSSNENFAEVIFEAYNLGCRFDYVNVNYETWLCAMNLKKV